MKLSFLDSGFWGRLDAFLQRKITGPLPYDENAADPRLPNASRERFRKAEIMTDATTKSAALEILTTARANWIADFAYDRPFWKDIQQEAQVLALSFGASDADVAEAIHQGDMRGAQLRLGLNR